MPVFVSVCIKTSGLDWMKFDPSAVSVRYLLPFVNFGGGREKTDENLSELDSKWKAHLAGPRRRPKQHALLVIIESDFVVLPSDSYFIF